MRVCPRRHYHTESEINIASGWKLEWCLDCGATRKSFERPFHPGKYSYTEPWKYPEITSLLRGRKGVHLEEEGVYKGISTFYQMVAGLLLDEMKKAEAEIEAGNFDTLEPLKAEILSRRNREEGDPITDGDYTRSPDTDTTNHSVANAGT